MTLAAPYCSIFYFRFRVFIMSIRIHVSIRVVLLVLDMLADFFCVLNSKYNFD